MTSSNTNETKTFQFMINDGVWYLLCAWFEFITTTDFQRRYSFKPFNHLTDIIIMYKNRFFFLFLLVNMTYRNYINFSSCFRSEWKYQNQNHEELIQIKHQKIHSANESCFIYKYVNFVCWMDEEWLDLKHLTLPCCILNK